MPQTSPKSPTVAQVSSFLQSFFPVRNGDTPFEYHVPARSSTFNNATSVPVSRVVLSVTPTPGFYAALSSSATTAPLAFLHRPWSLDRRRLPRHATVLSSHKGFDEALTVGNNPALAARLGMAVGDASRSAVIRGYKGDVERTIGILGLVEAGGVVVGRANLRAQIEAEFGGAVEGAFGFGRDDAAEGNTAETGIRALAIMNAFHPAEVRRVAEMAAELGIIPSAAAACQGILYLTGAVREPGLQAALDRGMAVVCVGHRSCEEWGVRYLATQVQQAWPSLEVEVILEEENSGT